MNNVWVQKSKTNKILKFIDNTGILRLRNMSSFYHCQNYHNIPDHNKWDTLYVAIIKTLKNIGGGKECWLLTTPDVCDIIWEQITGSPSNVSRKDREFVALIYGEWWLYSCPYMGHLQKTDMLIGTALNLDGSPNLVALLELA